MNKITKRIHVRLYKRLIELENLPLMQLSEEETIDLSPHTLRELKKDKQEIADLKEELNFLEGW